MSITMRIDDPSGVFDQDRDRITGQYNKAIKKVTDLLPVDDIGVVFKNRSDVIIPEVGIGCDLQLRHRCILGTLNPGLIAIHAGFGIIERLKAEQ